MLQLLPIVLVAFAGAAFLFRWQWLLWGLFCYLPFAGAFILWSEQSPLFLLAKDLFFVLPLYVAVFLLRPQLIQRTGIPAWLTFMLLVLALVVILQMLNPGVVNMAMALIGAKTWLLYIPLAYVVAATVREREDLVRLLRIIVLLAPVPCVVGLTQWGLSEAYGYREALTDFYGEAARGATQNFTQFDFGGTFRRLPSTFSNAPAFYVYTLVVLTAALALVALDRSRGWRLFGWLLVALALFAGLLSGMRAAFLFSPLLVAFYAVMGSRGSGAVTLLALLGLLSAGFFYITGYDADGTFEALAEHTGRYQEADFVWVQFSWALERAPFGFGTGTNTAASRYATEGLSPAELQSLGFDEVQYAKTVHELGIFGLIPFLVIVGGLVARAVLGPLQVRDPQLRRAYAAFAGFVVIVFLYFFKAWVIDVDPANVMFWVFVGLMFRTATLEGARLPDARSMRPPVRPLRGPLPQGVLLRRELPRRPNAL